jgi:multidrug transporter EmrE-like cation transporter
MEWLWASVAYAVFGAIGALGLFTMLYWFDVAAARSKRSTGVNARKR